MGLCLSACFAWEGERPRIIAPGAFQLLKVVELPVCLGEDWLFDFLRCRSGPDFRFAKCDAPIGFLGDNV